MSQAIRHPGFTGWGNSESMCSGIEFTCKQPTYINGKIIPPLLILSIIHIVHDKIEKGMPYADAIEIIRGRLRRVTKDMFSLSEINSLIGLAEDIAQGVGGLSWKPDA